MTPPKQRVTPDIAADPFQERSRGLRRFTCRVLGARFDFATESAALLRLVRWAYAGLPPHRLSAHPPRIAIRLALGEGGAPLTAGEPAPFALLSGAGFLCGAGPATSMAVLSEAQRAALVVVAPDMIRFAYQVRYELIELAVFTLAARVQRLMPLHAACVAIGGRGLLLIGASGAGKSTAALHCAFDGFDVVSEDSLFVTPETLQATGVANFVHARRESLQFLAPREAALVRRSPVIRRRSGVEKFEIDLRQGRFRLAPRPVRLVGVVELSAQQAGARPLLAQLGWGGLARRLRAGQPYAASLPGWGAFLQHLRRLPAFELRRGRHPEETVRALRTLLRAGRRAGG